MPFQPQSAQGARKAITTRLNNFPQASTEEKRHELAADIENCVDFIYSKLKSAEEKNAHLERVLQKIQQLANL